MRTCWRLPLQPLNRCSHNQECSILSILSIWINWYKTEKPWASSPEKHCWSLTWKFSFEQPIRMNFHSPRCRVHNFHSPVIRESWAWSRSFILRFGSLGNILCKLSTSFAFEHFFSLLTFLRRYSRKFKQTFTTDHDMDHSPVLHMCITKWSQTTQSSQFILHTHLKKQIRQKRIITK